MRKVELFVSSTLAEYERLEQFVLTFAQEQHYGQACTCNLLFCVKELFINAVTHGNRRCADCVVSCRLEECGDTLVVTMQDEGEGFVLETLPDPRQAPFYERSFGRGLFCMQSLAETISVEVNEQGCVVRLGLKFIS